MTTTNDYLQLITSEHRDKANFSAMVELDTSFAVRVQNLLITMIPIFDVDVAVGSQLDVIGQWVGISRNISIPISGIYFSWDSTSDVGWEYGTWKDPLAPSSITSLPDDAYRTLIRAKIAANKWDGTTEGAYTVWESVFPQYNILIQDNQNMSYDLIIVGAIVDSLTLALLVEGYLPLKPEGVHIDSYFVPADTNPAFGWDLDSPLITGWDTGSWMKEIAV